MNLLQEFVHDIPLTTPLTWEHPPLKWEPLPNGGMRVHVPAEVDYFRSPTGALVKDDAPYLWRYVSGDFVARAHVRPAHTNTYDAGALMVRHDERNWAKICYESTDFGTRAAVSVVTRDVSDDANGADLELPDLWLQICRVGDVFGMHYAPDGKSWRMVRLFHLAAPRTIQVGLVAQCPIGSGTTVDFLHFSIEQRTVQDLRAGA